jgi:small-conductance mechanosensitive channel
MSPVPSSRSRRIRALPLALALLLAGAAGAQLKPVLEAASGTAHKPAAAAADPRGAVRTRLSEIQATLSELQRRADPAGRGESFALLEAGLLTEEETALQARLAALDRADELARQQVEADARAAAGPEGAVPHPPPYTLNDVDAVSDARDAAAERAASLEQALRTAEEALGAASARHDQAETARRQAREAAEAAEQADVATAARLRESLRQAQAESLAAEARRALAALELENTRRELALQRQSAELLRAAAALVRERMSADRAPVRERLAALDEREIATTRALETAQRAKELAEQRLAIAERRLSASPAHDAALTAEAEARRSERQLAERAVGVYQVLLQRIAAQRQLVQRRFEVLVDPPPAKERRAFEAELEALASERSRELRLAQARRVELDQELAEARARADAEEAARAPSAAWSRRRADALATWTAELDRLLGEFTADQRSVARMLDEARAQAGGGGLVVALQELASGAAQLWRTELFAVQDYSITVGKLAGAVLLFALGVGLAHLASALVGRLLQHRAGYDHGAASAVSGLVYYMLLALVFLFALRAMGIPLTAFTVIGGALALGVGFASQAVIANFISGLILLAERPIKEGDLVEIDGSRGTVERIGPRSTRVRTIDNTHLIVPNSAFLEKTIRNLTFTNEDVRASVRVGVAYGSPLREVERLLLRAIHEQGKVLEFPEPVVLFTEFADSALTFQAFFWIRSGDMGERARIESDVRHQVDALLREAGITVAFPQRDLNLRAAHPLEVRVLGGDPGEPRG